MLRSPAAPREAGDDTKPRLRIEVPGQRDFAIFSKNWKILSAALLRARRREHPNHAPGALPPQESSIGSRPTRHPPDTEPND